nr:hypothetical protein [uncultured Lichenicoccus sp.]
MIAAVVVMALLIAAGTAILVATVIKRLVHAPATLAASSARLPPVTASLDQPAGTRIAGAVRQSDSSLALLLSGGGRPDRVVVWDELTGRIAARADLDQ